jgi:hypothetical protein
MGQTVMAIIAAQISAIKKSRATQAAKSTTRSATAVRQTARAYESKGSTGLLIGRSSLPLLLGMRTWRSIRDQILVAPAHSFPASPRHR